MRSRFALQQAAKVEKREAVMDGYVKAERER